VREVEVVEEGPCQRRDGCLAVRDSPVGRKRISMSPTVTSRRTRANEGRTRKKPGRKGRRCRYKEYSRYNAPSSRFAPSTLIPAFSKLFRKWLAPRSDSHSRPVRLAAIHHPQQTRPISGYTPCTHPHLRLCRNLTHTGRSGPSPLSQ
jgi:hypothetical protein